VKIVAEQILLVAKMKTMISKMTIKFLFFIDTFFLLAIDILNRLRGK